MYYRYFVNYEYVPHSLYIRIYARICTHSYILKRSHTRTHTHIHKTHTHTHMHIHAPSHQLTHAHTRTSTRTLYIIAHNSSNYRPHEQLKLEPSGQETCVMFPSKFLQDEQYIINSQLRTIETRQKLR